MSTDMQNEIEKLKIDYKELAKEVCENRLSTSVKLTEIQGDTTRIREMLEKDYKNLEERVEKLESLKDKLTWTVISSVVIALLSLVVTGIK